MTLMTLTRHAPMPGRPLDVKTCDSPRTMIVLQTHAFGDGELMQPLPIGARQAHAERHGGPLPSFAPGWGPLPSCKARRGLIRRGRASAVGERG